MSEPEDVPVGAVGGRIVLGHSRVLAHVVRDQQGLELDAHVPVDVVLDDKRGLESGCDDIFQEVEMSDPRRRRSVLRCVLRGAFSNVLKSLHQLFGIVWLCWDAEVEARQRRRRSESSCAPARFRGEYQQFFKLES